MFTVNTTISNPLSRAVIFTKLGSIVVSGKLPTFPSPNLIFCPKKEVSVNVRLGEGYVGSSPETPIDPQIFSNERSALLVQFQPYTKDNKLNVLHRENVIYDNLLSRLLRIDFVYNYKQQRRDLNGFFVY